MLTLQQIKADPQYIISRLAVKGFEAEKPIARVIALDDLRRELQHKNDNAAAELKKKADSIGRLMKEGKRDEAAAAKEGVAVLKEEQKAIGDELARTEDAIREELLNIPNIPCEAVPEGHITSAKRPSYTEAISCAPAGMSFLNFLQDTGFSLTLSTTVSLEPSSAILS